MSAIVLEQPQVSGWGFSRLMQRAHRDGVKVVSRVLLTAANSVVSPGRFAGVDLSTARARPHEGLRVSCVFDSGKRRVVNVLPVIQPGALFWEMAASGKTRLRDSRRTLRVTSVDVARVQDMTFTEAREQGVTYLLERRQEWWRAAMIDEWNVRHKRVKGATWSDNPWTWIYRYEVIERNVRDLIKKTG